MIVGLHPDRVGAESYSEKWAEVLRRRGVEVRLLDLLAPDALRRAGECDGVMWRWGHHPQDKQSAQRILYVIEHQLGIPVYPDSATAWHYDEKLAQFYLLEALGAPVPRTWLFWRTEDALAWVREAPYPVVLKLSSGAGSANVLMVESARTAREMVERLFLHGLFPYSVNEFAPPKGCPRSWRQAKALVGRALAGLRYTWGGRYPPLPYYWRPEHGYAYFQEFLPGNEFDTRITVIGRRAFGFRRLNRPGDFRASGSGRLEHNPEAVDRRCLEIAFDLSRRGRFQSMAYDFLMEADRPVVAEISYAFADTAVHDCPGHWDESLKWTPGNLWPEEAQVEDFLLRLESRAASRAAPGRK